MESEVNGESMVSNSQYPSFLSNRLHSDWGESSRRQTATFSYCLVPSLCCGLIVSGKGHRIRTCYESSSQRTIIWGEGVLACLSFLMSNLGHLRVSFSGFAWIHHVQRYEPLRVWELELVPVEKLRVLSVLMPDLALGLSETCSRARRGS